MKSIDKRVLKFIETHRVSVLGIQQKNSIHSATLHYAFSKDTFSFYFITGKSSRKCESLLSGNKQNASLVIGFDEKEFTTIQLEGNVQIATEIKSLEEAWSVYLGKFPERKNRKEAEEVAMLEFKPSWWRFTNLKKEPNVIISSE